MKHHASMHGYGCKLETTMDKDTGNKSIRENALKASFLSKDDERNHKQKQGCVYQGYTILFFMFKCT